ncbi:hypothetical protein A7985_01805 [Pseudoalteromonas luteoviolacea]|uniref:SMI1/KNR4 family protein n=1 Tax=Pseudoalteromonas luteoviolacea TaxID=43657 RepID=A0A1C0TTS8_9GAMM|nr:hypothetical protein [Pseudoalteromonas luteoviolacea]OCQ22717.1 hypothetical protein A7985_01805 [Pseudoalteromonas luteoviolacea]
MINSFLKCITDVGKQIHNKYFEQSYNPKAFTTGPAHGEKSWSAIRMRIEELKQLDRYYTVLGSSGHEYKFGEQISAYSLRQYEEKMGFELPEQVFTLYQELGNGGAGPDFGFFKLQTLALYHPQLPWPGSDCFKHPTRPFTDIQAGMIGVLELYYAHMGCVITTGTHVGQLVEYCDEQEFLFESQGDLIDFYHRWLDKHLSYFNKIKRLLVETRDVAKTLEILEGKLSVNSDDRLLTILGLFDFPEGKELYPSAYFSHKVTPDGDCITSLEPQYRRFLNRKLATYLEQDSSYVLSFIKEELSG